MSQTMKRWKHPGLTYPEDMAPVSRGPSISAGISHARTITAEQVVQQINEQGKNAGAAGRALGVSRRSVLNKLAAAGYHYDPKTKRAVKEA